MSDTSITERQQHWLDHIEAAEAFDGSIADKAGDDRSDTGSFAVLRGETSAKSPLPNLSHAAVEPGLKHGGSWKYRRSVRVCCFAHAIRRSNGTELGVPKRMIVEIEDKRVLFLGFWQQPRIHL